MVENVFLARGKRLLRGAEDGGDIHQAVIVDVLHRDAPRRRLVAAPVGYQRAHAAVVHPLAAANALHEVEVVDVADGEVGVAVGVEIGGGQAHGEDGELQARGGGELGEQAVAVVEEGGGVGAVGTEVVDEHEVEVVVAVEVEPPADEGVGVDAVEGQAGGHVHEGAVAAVHEQGVRVSAVEPPVPRGLGEVARAVDGLEEGAVAGHEEVQVAVPVHVAPRRTPPAAVGRGDACGRGDVGEVSRAVVVPQQVWGPVPHQVEV